MGSILLVVGRVLGILSIVVLGVLIWKTVEYFDRIHDEQAKTVVSFDVLALFLVQVFLIVKLAIV